MNKKGNFPDVVEWIEFALAFALVTGVVLAFIFNFDANIQAADNSTIPDVSKAASASLKTSVTSGLDYLFLSIFLVFTTFSVMAARLIPSSPKFMLVSVFALIMLPFGAMFVENIWVGFAANSAMTGVFGSMIFMPFMMNHLVWFVLAYSLAVGISLLSKEGGLPS